MPTKQTKICTRRIDLMEAAKRASENPFHKTPEQRDSAYWRVIEEGQKRETGKPVTFQKLQH